ncbi:glucosaminidase domain-containing protein [Echinimonas agarilytica]|uniref:Glucosaminidase domain-containing protein n=1 Tax=Echinimonas agarilytica TaxID=1215918 RepID=A0AA41WA95_9GAMM|nr:glucosaminidase domain-containing protein [Echinimonas agarilytica]MCM2681197.1 glucosaminidase domain-containing protein [Echinimonas agarilytica]
MNSFFPVLVMFATSILVGCSHSDGKLKKATNAKVNPHVLESAIVEPITMNSWQYPMPNFESMDNVGHKKLLFAQYLMPSIERVNKAIVAQRVWVEEMSQKLKSGQTLPEQSITQLNTLAKEYQIDHAKPRDIIAELELRVHPIPAEMVLAQAALESGWGTSRFAKDEFNFFGIRCFKIGCGVKANQANGNFYVRSFDSPLDSVTAYANALNTHLNYVEFRNVRRQLHQDNHNDVTQLIAALEGYAEHSEYQKLVARVVRQNQQIFEQVIRQV